ncbi:unnamed protein product, partial [Polarella glacialis]
MTSGILEGGASSLQESAWRLVSASPLVFLYEGFATRSECKSLVEAGTRLRHAIDGGHSELCEALARFGVAHGALGFRRVYCLPGSRKLRAEFDIDDTHQQEPSTGQLLKRFEAAVGDFVGCEPHCDEDSCVLNLTPGREDGAALEGGLHVDTFNDEPRRFATAILYLNDLHAADGGQTVWPAAANAPAEVVEAGKKLLHAGLESTLQPEGGAPAEALEAHAAQVLRAHTGEQDLLSERQGLSLRPRCGSLVVFFTRGLDGKVDPRSWHGSAAVRKHADKWTLQTFKAMPVGKENNDTTCLFAAERASRHIFAARPSLPPIAFRALKATGGRAVLGAQRLVEEVLVLGGGDCRLSLLSAHHVAGPLLEGRLGDLTGLVLWPASIALAQYISEPGRVKLSGRRVLDLGCGCGLLGLVAGTLGRAAEVVLLDASPEAAALAALSLEANGLSPPSFRVVKRSWSEELADLGLFDVILAADVLYPPAGADSETCAQAAKVAASELLAVLGRLLARGGEAFVAVQG